MFHEQLIKQVYQDCHFKTRAMLVARAFDFS